MKRNVRLLCLLLALLTCLSLFPGAAAAENGPTEDDILPATDAADVPPAGEIPAVDGVEAPAVEVEEAPAVEEEEAPAVEEEEAPAVEVEDTPAVDGVEAPAVEEEETPAVEVEEAPAVDGEEAPAVDVKEAPAVETEEVSAVEEEEKAPALDGDLDILPEPTVIQLKNKEKGIYLKWEAVDGATHYRIRRVTADGEWSLFDARPVIAETTKRSYTDKTAVIGTKYYYFVESVDSSGKAASSDNSSSQTLYPITRLWFDAPKLKKVSITGSADASGIQITWEGVDNDQVAYQILRKTGNGKWKKLGETWSTSYVDYSAKPTRKYTYTVRCIDYFDSNPLSSYDTAGLTKKMMYKAPKIASLDSNAGSVRLTWMAPLDNTVYVRVLRRTPKGSWKKLADVEPTGQSGWSYSMSYIDTTAKDGKTYYYALQFVSSNGKTAYSSHSSTGKKIKYYASRITGTYNQTEARSMLKLINAWRTGSDAWQWNSDDKTKTKFNVSGGTKLGKLTYDYNLEKIAMKRAAELAVCFDHTRPNGTDFSTLTISGTHAIGENIAYGWNMYEYPASDVFEDWQESDMDYYGQGHRRNMLKYNTVGIACLRVNNEIFWVQEFGYTNSGAKKTRANDSLTVVTIER